MKSNRATAGATLEAIMNKQDSIARQAAHDRSRLVELSDQQLDVVAGGNTHVTKTIDQASPNLFVLCCNGKHFTI
jgi:type VI protein secretion system component Hcp